MDLHDPRRRLPLLRAAARVALIPAQRAGETPLQIPSGAIDAEVVDALPGAPGVDVGVGNGGLRPLCFAAAVVAFVQHGEGEGEGGEADYENEEHYNPFPVGGEPGKVIC